MKKLSKGLARSAMAKGFTIIELIVVIAIIAVLAGIVLVNVTQYINKGKAAAIISTAATLITTNTAYFADPANSSKTGDNFILDNCDLGTTIYNAIDKNGGTGINCIGNGTNQEWCLSVTMPAGSQYTTYCVDSSGYKGEIGTSGCDGAANHEQCN